MLENNYGQMSDEDVIAMIRQGHRDGTAYLLNKYKSTVRKKARGMFLIGGETEDLIQEGMIGLFEAIQNYDDQKEMNFHSFAELCVTRQLCTAVKASQRKKHGPLNSYVSLYSEMVSGTDENMVRLADVLPAEKSAEELFIDKENAELTEQQLTKRLSKFENRVLELYLSGTGYTRIAEILEKDQKSVDNALQRIKTKARLLTKRS